MRKYLNIFILMGFILPVFAFNLFMQVKAEVLFNCTNVAANNASAYLQINAATGNVTGRTIALTYTAVPAEQPTDSNLLRPLNGYRVWWSGGSPLEINFQQNGGIYTGTATLSNYPIEVRNYEFRLETTNGTVIPCNGNANFSININGDQDLTFVDGTAFRGKGCNDIVGFDEPVGYDLMTCARNVSGGVDVSAFGNYPASIQVGCAQDNISLSELACGDFLSANPNVTVACISCPGDTPGAGAAATVKWGELCPAGSEDLPCDISGNNTYRGNTTTCRRDSQNQLRCLFPAGIIDLAQQECIVGQNECSVRDRNTFETLRCQGASTIGMCTAEPARSCNPGGRIISPGSPCLAGEYCFGAKDNANGRCVVPAELTQLLSDVDYLRRVGISRQDILDAQREFPELVKIIPDVDGNNGGLTVTPTNGVCNCPGASKTPACDPANPQIQDERNNEPGLRDRFFACVRCVGANNTWTDSLGCVETTASGLFTRILQIALGVVGGITLLRLIILGYQYNFSDKKADIKTAAKDVIATLGGLLLILFSVVLLRIIGVNILDIVPPGFFGT